MDSYAWSSYPAYIGRNQKIPDWLELGHLINACGFDAKLPKRRTAYRSLLGCRMKGEVGEDSVDELVEKQLRRGWYIGEDFFRGWLSGILKDLEVNEWSKFFCFKSFCLFSSSDGGKEIFD